MPHRSNSAEQSHILEVINDVFARHRDGTLSDAASRRALYDFITAYPAGHRLISEDGADLQAYLDYALQVSQKATSSYDAETAACAHIVMGMAIGHPAALKTVRHAVKTGVDSQTVNCL